jgi:hypothetical protein
MKLASAALVALCFGLIGCGVGSSEQDAAALREEFSDENVEQGMIDSGRADQLEAYKERERTLHGTTEEEERGDDQGQQ